MELPNKHWLVQQIYDGSQSSDKNQFPAHNLWQMRRETWSLRETAFTEKATPLSA